MSHDGCGCAEGRRVALQDAIAAEREEWIAAGKRAIAEAVAQERARCEGIASAWAKAHADVVRAAGSNADLARVSAFRSATAEDIANEIARGPERCLCDSQIHAQVGCPAPDCRYRGKDSEGAARQQRARPTTCGVNAPAEAQSTDGGAREATPSGSPTRVAANRGEAGEAETAALTASAPTLGDMCPHCGQRKIVLWVSNRKEKSVLGVACPDCLRTWPWPDRVEARVPPASPAAAPLTHVCRRQTHDGECSECAAEPACGHTLDGEPCGLSRGHRGPHVQGSALWACPVCEHWNAADVRVCPACAPSPPAPCGCEEAEALRGECEELATMLRETNAHLATAENERDAARAELIHVGGCLREREDEVVGLGRELDEARALVANMNETCRVLTARDDEAHDDRENHVEWLRRVATVLTSAQAQGGSEWGAGTAPGKLLDEVRRELREVR